MLAALNLNGVHGSKRIESKNTLSAVSILWKAFCCVSGLVSILELYHNHIAEFAC